MPPHSAKTVYGFSVAGNEKAAELAYRIFGWCVQGTAGIASEGICYARLRMPLRQSREWEKASNWYAETNKIRSAFEADGEVGAGGIYARLPYRAD